MAENPDTQGSKAQGRPTQDSGPNTPTDEAKKASEATNPGTPDAGAMSSSDSAVGDRVGISEGEVKALRYKAGVNQLAGNEANTLSWEASPAGQTFLKNESDRKKAVKAEEKAYAAQTNDKGLSPAEAAYAEVVSKARKG